MPGYGTLGPHEGGELLPWSWAEQRLASSHDYWLTNVRPDGRPHLMPVWCVWLDGALWFSSSLSSHKARNLAHDPRCSVATDDACEPVSDLARSGFIDAVPSASTGRRHRRRGGGGPRTRRNQVRSPESRPLARLRRPGRPPLLPLRVKSSDVRSMPHGAHCWRLRAHAP